MFALAIRYLNGWAMATHPADRWRAEWPPHPDRIFMALAAAHFETGEDVLERAALEWLERLPPPEVSASGAETRDVVPTYVPVNDIEISRPQKDSAAKLRSRLEKIGAVASLKQAKKRGLGILPEFRSRQSLTFPVAIPHDPDVHLMWRDVQCPVDHLARVRGLCEKVTSVGDPSSLVQMWIADRLPATTWVPDASGLHGAQSLRVFGRGGESGRLARLARHHAMEEKLGRRQRIPCESMRYRPAEAAARSDGGAVAAVFDSELIVLSRLQGPRVGLESTLPILEALRGAVMKGCAVQPPPAWISGHAASGGPSPEPHLAFLPLADVGHPHALGHLLGVAIALPRLVSAGQEKLLAGIFLDSYGEPHPIELRTSAGAWGVGLADEDPRLALQSGTWTAAGGGSPGARWWATVTPIVFDRHPKERWKAADPPRIRAGKQAAYWSEVEDMIAGACAKIGLPRPMEVTALPTSALRGAPAALRMPRLRRKDGSERQQVHAVLRFQERVVGPVLLGAGRFRGYGLCRPVEQEEG